MSGETLQALYDHVMRIENMPDNRVVYAVYDYKEKLETYLSYYKWRSKRGFRDISTRLWAIDEILSRISGKSLKGALEEIRQFKDFLDDYDGPSLSNRQSFIIASEEVDRVYDMLVDQFR